MLTTRTPEAHKWALEQFATFRSDGQFLPFAVGQQTVIFPGLRRRRGVGRLGVRSRDRPSLRQRQRPAWTGGLAPAEPPTERHARSTCATAPPATATIAQGTPPQIAVAGRHRRPEAARRDHRGDPQGRGRMAGFPTLSDDGVDAIVEYLVTGEDTATEAPASQRRTEREVPLHRLPQVPRSRRLPGRAAALGHAERRST